METSVAPLNHPVAAREPAANLVAQSIGVAAVNTRSGVSSLEVAAFFVAAIMMLGPLAAAAYGAHFGA